MRIVLDTNVLLAGFAAHGLCEAVVAACIQGHEVVLSDYILAELARNLAKKLRMPAEQVAEIDAFLREHAELVEPVPLPRRVRADPDDVPALGTARAGKVDALVTGDRELLSLGKIGRVPILSPREFYERLL